MQPRTPSRPDGRAILRKPKRHQSDRHEGRGVACRLRSRKPPREQSPHLQSTFRNNGEMPHRDFPGCRRRGLPHGPWQGLPAALGDARRASTISRQPSTMSPTRKSVSHELRARKSASCSALQPRVPRCVSETKMARWCRGCFPGHCDVPGARRSACEETWRMDCVATRSRHKAVSLKHYSHTATPGPQRITQTDERLFARSSRSLCCIAVMVL